MSEALYERYKDALRRGHVAALRGRLDAALVAYREAAGLAPERALPHASIGSVLFKLGRRDEALGAYAVALDRAPRDEAALAGRADVLAALGRRVEAAEDLDLLASVQEAAGRLPEACDSARRALELAESRSRRRHVEGLTRRLGEIPADAAAAAALERALGILEPVVGPVSATAGVAELDAPGTTPEAPAEGPPAQAEPDHEAGARAGAAPETAPEAPSVPGPEPEREPEPVGGVRLVAEAEELFDAGDAGRARDRLLAAAKAHREAAELSAALDACYLALSIAPADPDLHLTLAALYLDRGWRTPAADKLLLLDRLADLDGQTAARRRIAALAADRLPDEPRLAALGR